MSPLPISISDWKALSAADPDRAAQAFIGKLETIPSKTRRRVFASVPDLLSLSDAFTAAAENSPKAAPLLGVPFLLKDLFDFPGVPTTASSAFLSRVRPTTRTESALSASLRQQGAVFAGKTHLNEFAYGLSGENLHFGDCPHPSFPDRVSGGSSSGSAWAVAKGIAPIATGTDTGGSIRVPAAWCGIYGLRTSPNRWSTDGCVPLAPSFDTPGWFTATSEDMELSILALICPKTRRKRPLKGVSLLSYVDGLSDEFRAKFMEAMEMVNGNLDPAATKEFSDATRSVARHYSVLQSQEAYSVHQAWLDEHRAEYDPVVWQRIDRGRHWSPADVDAAKKSEAKLAAFFESAFQSYDFVAMPATQSPAIKASEHTDAFRNELLRITAPGSFARCPVLTIPIHLKDGESQGIQIMYKDERSDLPLRVLEALRERVEE
ncbi:amidase [Pelagicoccus sp. SDUM812003]|uniref:amidase n=1 Tax=Pelagicoccus sp. SDUM812003 TaxID=3041267 RepID=UPI00280C72D4|nr:amidase [Pelagicoccus sp. SDUM812003]MDQ8205483.1 amidase [Pelagicoccus sp. SDUM812003]